MLKINYSKININIISFFISIIIFILIIKSLKCLSLLSNTPISNNNEKQDFIESNISQDIELEQIHNWQIQIEKLNLQTAIKEGVAEEVIKENVGHYTTSSLLYGNVALKAYNTGENKKHFANLKQLEIGDEIKYILNNDIFIYIVKENVIIDENEEEQYILKENKVDILTLVTYIKDMPSKRRCVIAEKTRKEINEEKS